MAILFDRALFFSLFNGLVPNRTKFQFVLQNDIDQALCDLHLFTSSSEGIPPLITAVKIQTTNNVRSMTLEVPTISLDIDIRSFLESTSCIPAAFPQSFFLLTLTFNRPFLDSESLQIAPTNSQGDIVVA